MVPRNIIDLPILDEPTPSPPRCPSEPMMMHMQVSEAGCSPSQHVRFHFIYCVRAGSHPQAVDRFPASPAVDFRASPNMKHRMLLEHDLFVLIMVKNSPSNANRRVLTKSLKRVFEIIRP